MEWIKIFTSDSEARSKLSADKPQLLIVHGQRICLVWHNGDFRAVQDSCTHNGESLSKGRINFLGEIICPWHGYRFNMNTGAACDSSSRDLRTYPMKSDETGFFIGI